MAKIMHETFPKSVSIHTECPGDLWLVKGDATQLHQVLLNLCVNARDAMPDGGSLSIIVRNRTLTAEQAVRHPQARAGDYLALKVADSGCGISSDTMERIFDPFFTTKGDKGTGLGLSTVLGIVKSHGGFIDVESAPGEGSRFTVYLPAFQNGLPDISNGKPVPVFMGHGETVLCVDDEEQIRKMIDITLRRFGYRVLLANHGASAVAIFQENRTQIDVMLTDLCMPLMDGWRAIQEIRLLDPLLKIVAMSGQITPEAVEKAKILGIGDIVEKPLGITQLLETLHRLLHEPAPVMASPRSQSGLGDLEPVTHSGTKGSVSQLL
jgi:CheY-like chemotaxis protein